MSSRRSLWLLVDQAGASDWTTWVVLGVIGLAIYGGVSLFDRLGGQAAPKIITADGEIYVACRDTVSITSDGGGFFTSADIFKMSFTDASGLSHTLRGVHKIQISDVPKYVDAPMPINPGFIDRDGKPFAEGREYTWSDGTKARYRNGQWEAVRVSNDVCAVK